MTIEKGMVNGTKRDGGEPLGFGAVPSHSRRSEGTIDTSPAFQCRVGVGARTSAEGTAEHFFDRMAPQPSRSGLGIFLTRAPGVETPGYSHVVPAGRRRSLPWSAAVLCRFEDGMHNLKCIWPICGGSKAVEDYRSPRRYRDRPRSAGFSRVSLRGVSPCFSLFHLVSAIREKNRIGEVENLRFQLQGTDAQQRVPTRNVSLTRAVCGDFHKFRFTLFHLVVLRPG